MFSESTWAELGARESGFQRLFNGEKPDRAPYWYFNGDLKQIRPELLVVEKDREGWLDNQLGAVKANVEEALDSGSLFYPIIEMFSLFGTHYMDILFGADVKWHEEQFWSENVEYSVADIGRAELEGSELIGQTLELAKWIKERTGGRFLIAMPDVGCPLNIAINLFGERFLMALALAPENARRALGIIAEATRSVYKLLIETVGQETLRCHNAYHTYTPHDYAGLSVCATQLISAEHFRTCVADADDAAVPAVYKGMIQHICGRSTQHIEELARRERVKGVQLNDAGADDFEAYFNGLRADQVVYVSPTDCTPLEKIMSISKGDRTILLGAGRFDDTISG